MTRTLKLAMTASALLSVMAVATVPFVSLGTQDARASSGAVKFACEANWQNGGCGTSNEVNGTNHGGGASGTQNRKEA